jgi:hypothetical protein
MRGLELLWALLGKHVPFPPGRLSKLSDDSYRWENEQKETGSKIGKLLSKTDTWYFQALFAILFLWGNKAIANWQISNSEPDLLDDDYDDDDLPSSSSRAVNR